MPELPEVETIAQQLRAGRLGGAPALVGRTIIQARALWPREIDGLSARSFERKVRNRRVASVGRHGKYLIIELGAAAGDPPLSMLIHLRMSGRLDVVAQDEAYTKHARVVWLLDGGWALRFDDARKFGRVFLVADAAQITGRIGPDALLIGAGEFAERLRRKRGALKPLLLDQTFIAGVGNIYADESLFMAGLHPKRLAQTLSDADRLRLHAAIRQVLLAGIAANGASFDWVYPGGNYQENFRVYGRTGQACVTCGRPIQRIIVGQRSTHYCEHCQV
ncbi:MAG: DNA-formamidopyrimidine glycosylase [Chloroflexi bacterium]|nr:DNA-formamidopyrimidine glycosylase [Chloroflexota bacterium]MCL5274120.1 DNA-formamidopyrimidine glycosylase [Chloroflexota bacterium]